MTRSYPGKGLTQAELRRIRARAWAAFMDEAREEARRRGQRVRVIGLLSGRQKWVYVIGCGSSCNVCRSAS